MHYLEIIKLVCDLSLLGALAFICNSFMRASRGQVSSAQVNGLETDLREAVKEAETAGRELNNQLQKRRQELEKLLYEIETVEHRLARSITTAEEKKATLETGIKAALNTARTIQAAAARRPNIEPDQLLELPDEQIINNPSREESAVTASSPEPPSFRRAPAVEAPARQPHRQTAARAAHHSLSREIEKETTAAAGRYEQREQKRYRGGPNEEDTLSKIMGAADEALRAGKEIHSVTQSPRNDRAEEFIADDLRDLTEPSSSETRLGERNDPRLGVLGGIRRQVQLV